MTEPSKETARFGEQMIAAGQALKFPPGANGGGLSAEQLRQPVEMGFLERMIVHIGETVGKQLRALEQRIAGVEKMRCDEISDAVGPELRELARRIEAIEQKRLSYEGTWDATKTYNRGSFCTHAGSLWHAEDANVGVRPGAGSTAWKLAVKRGKAAR